VLLVELLSADRIRVPLSARTKDDVLQELVDLAARDHDAKVRSAILAAVREREGVLSTGIGSGVAIPHGKTPVIDQLIVTAGVAGTPIEFDALDGKPVELFFLLIGPESASGAHVKTLSRISRLLRRESLRTALRGAKSAEEFLGIVKSSEVV